MPWMLLQFPCCPPAERYGQNEDKAQAAPSDPLVEHGPAEMQFHGVWQRLSQAQGVCARGNLIALSENICVNESVAKTNLERCVKFPARFVLASNDAEMLLLICIAALFWGGCKYTHVPCHRLCFHQEHFHITSLKMTLINVAFQGLTRRRRRSCHHCEANGGPSPYNICVCRAVG